MRRTLSTALSCSLVFVLMSAHPGSAQDWVGRGRVQGEVRGHDGQPIPGATVRLHPRGQEGTGPNPVTTDRRGRWSVLGLSHGPWTVVIEKDGYLTAEGEIPVSEGGVNPPLNITLTSVEETPSAQRAREIVETIERANALFQEGHFAEARDLYRGPLDEVDEETRLTLRRAIARTYVAEGRSEDALEELERLVAERPGDAETLKVLAVVQGELGREEEAVATLRRVLELTPEDADLLELMANLLMAAGKEQEAQAYIDRLPEGRKIDPSAYLNQGIEHYNEGRYARAVEVFDRVVHDHPELADVYYYRAMAHLAQGSTVEAKADLERLLELDPSHSRAEEAREFLASL